jgi:predicted DNA-binding transcriptional regulator AlpA
VERLALRPKDLETAIGVDERTIQRWRSASRFPKPDIAIGRTLLWKVETIQDWLARGGNS